MLAVIGRTRLRSKCAFFATLRVPSTKGIYEEYRTKYNNLGYRKQYAFLRHRRQKNLDRELEAQEKIAKCYELANKHLAPELGKDQAWHSKLDQRSVKLQYDPGNLQWYSETQFRFEYIWKKFPRKPKTDE